MVQHKTHRTTLGLLPALAALLGVSAIPALAEDSSPPAADARTDAQTEPPQAVDEVIVRGRRLSEIEDDLRIYINEFLDEVAAPPRGRGYARWQRQVCIGVHNLDPSAAQYVVDRISIAAHDVGLEPGEPGCNPEVNILFTTNASETAARMVETEPRAFHSAWAGMDLGLGALDEFVKSDRAVRWWHMSAPMSAHDGTVAIDVGSKSCGEPRCPPKVNVQGASRIHGGTVDQMLYVLVIVDATKLKGTTWQQLADYLAVVSLAQVDANANLADFDSILNLFSNPKAYSGLTDWDRSYLSALYAYDQQRVKRAAQNQIVSYIAERELEGR